MSNKSISKEKASLNNITYLMVILALIVINLGVFISHHTTKKVEKTEDKPATENVIQTEYTEETKTQAIENIVGEMGERNRCQTYIGEFFNWIENDQYDKAYNVLNPTFKENNFATLDAFKAYVINKYPKDIVIDYTDIDRQAPYFVLYTTIDDGSDDSFAAFDQRIVVKENGNNNFEISFQID